MKKVLLLLVCCSLFAFSSKANDTLTRAQVYNFSVGDTFDYHYFGGGVDNPIPHSESYARQIIAGMYYSAVSDTLFLIRRTVYPNIQIDTTILTNLAGDEIFLLSDTTIDCQFSYNQDSNSIYNHRKINRVEASCFEHYLVNNYGEGLGKVYSYFNNELHPPDFQIEYTTELIYYAKGAEHWGSPLFNSVNLIHYTPLPEECATWTDDIYCDFPPLSHNCLYLREQIHSGNKIAYHGHTYVEMIYRSYNFTNNYYTPDSLIGYYRNDTVNAKAIFYQSVSDTSFLEYDFNYPCAAPNCLTQVMVGGQLRTKWPDYIEGVGGTGGLIPVKNYTPFTPGSPTPYHFWGTLKTFCVCGQLLYAADSTATCSVLTGVNEATDKNIVFQITPNPATNQVNITIDETLTGGTLTITDITGRKMADTNLTTNKYSLLNTDYFPNGIYFVTIRNEGASATRKLIIEK